mmetsp:Transcript_5745/g.18446  ORF Transcript_5745/g.18446 Transcript_5745/m.18446 type:complete len:339 (+) Transcript_5745:125-1141(+)
MRRPRASLGTISRAKLLWAPLWGELALLLVVVVDLERVEDGLVHVEVLVRGEPADEADVVLRLGQRAVALVERAVLRVGHRVVRVALGGRVLPRNERPLDLPVLDRLGLVGHVLVLDDARVRHVSRRVVDHHRLLEVALLGLGHPDLLEADRAVLELGHALLRKVGVDRARVHKHAIVGQRARRPLLEVVDAQPQRDVWVVEQHVFEDARVAVQRQRLPLVAKVAVVGGRAARQPHQHRRVELGRVLVPLLLGVVLEDPLVQPRPHARKCRLLPVGRLGAGRRNALSVVPRLHLLLGRDCLAEERVDRLLRRRDGHQPLDAVLVRHLPLDAVVKRDPP